jgi:hypothetical protein
MSHDAWRYSECASPKWKIIYRYRRTINPEAPKGNSGRQAWRLCAGDKGPEPENPEEARRAKPSPNLAPEKNGIFRMTACSPDRRLFFSGK